jgi:transposase InsO family protein
LLLGYSRQSYYQGIKFTQQKAYEAEIIISEVLRHREKQKRIGTRKLLHEMADFLTMHDFQIGRDSMFSLLFDHGLLVTKRRRKGSTTTLSRHRFKKYPNIIKGMVPCAPNQLWVADITYIHLSEGFAYLSLVTDAYSRKIVGFNLRKDLSAKGPLEALKMALGSAKCTKNLIHHSDRGVQYCSDDYVAMLEKSGAKLSMTEKGDPLENAIAERVNGILKTELLEEVYTNFETAQNAVAIACSTYNHLRPHNSINNLKPFEAHQLQGNIPRLWKNHYQINKSKKEVEHLRV